MNVPPIGRRLVVGHMAAVRAPVRQKPVLESLSWRAAGLPSYRPVADIARKRCRLMMIDIFLRRSMISPPLVGIPTSPCLLLPKTTGSSCGRKTVTRASIEMIR